MRIGKRVTKRNYLIHQHSYTTTVVAPTCTEAGYTLHECACGYSYQTDPVSALGHAYFPILNSDGTMLRCLRCGDETEEHIRPVEPGNPSVETMGLRTVNDTDSEVRMLDSTVVQDFAYVYNGGTLMQMVIETTVDDGAPVTETLSFSYDALGKPMNVIYNGTAYFYAVNLQGDVMAIVDTSGTAVVSYSYDAWGNILSVTGTMADTLGESNPLTYRGYVYDHETSCYYLQSRYYDPESGRFINADALVATGQGLLGNNMFAYCGNNPVSREDPTGHAFMQMCFNPDGVQNMLGPGLWGGGSGSGGMYGLAGAAGSANVLKKIKDIATNSSEAVVERDLKNNGIAFYKGCLVMIADLPGEGSAFSYGIIVLDEYYESASDWAFEATLNHEYGHAVHFGQVGLPTYTVTAAIPSLICAGLSKVSPWINTNYYSLPWERTADYLGGVNRGNYLPGVVKAATIYWGLTQAISFALEG